jgi:alpha-amylase
MGFNAIQISPIEENTEDGFMGYWTKDFNRVNPHFGTEQDLQDLVTTAHNRDIWVMVDINVNNVGPVGEDYLQIHPYNQTSDYHQYANKYDNYCDGSNSTSLDICMVDGDLPDLDQSNPVVRKGLLDHVSNIVDKYGFDGIRVNACKNMDGDFLKELGTAAGVF